LRIRTSPLDSVEAPPYELHQVDPERDRDLAHEVGHERQGALEDAHEGQAPAREVRADLRAELRDALADLLLGEEHLRDVRLQVGGLGHPDLSHRSSLERRLPRRHGRPRREPPRSDRPRSDWIGGAVSGEVWPGPAWRLRLPEWRA